MTDAERCAIEVRRQIPSLKRGTLKFWGLWFGRPYDNVHAVVSCGAEADLLRFCFDGGEVLKVWSPSKLTASPKEFRIGDAERVRWEWYYYGRPQISENLRFQELSHACGGQTNVEWYKPDLTCDFSQAAVEIL